MKRYVCLPALSLLAACAQQPVQQSAPTVGELTRQPAPEAPAGQAGDRARAIQSYEEFLKNAEDPMLRAEAMRRLADLRLEEGEARRAASPGEDAPKTENQRVIALYEQRLKAYPYHPKNDEVLYQLSRAYENEGLPEKAMEALDKLVRSYPYSPKIAEAQFRRGEMLFVRRHYKDADLAYKAVLGKGPTSGFYDQALYKRGWSLFKQSQYFEGLDLFIALIDRKAVDGRLELDRLSRAEREQIEDTLRAISLSFAYLDGPDTVAEYFRQRGNRKDEDVMYASLGNNYLKKERYSDAAATYQAFVAAYPNSNQSPDFQLKAIDAFRKGNFPSQVLEAQQAFVRLFDLRSPYWSRRKPEDQPKVVAQLQSSLRDLARHFHAQAQKSKKAEDFKLAGDWYQRYLTNFPTAAGAQEMRFLYAELLYEKKDFPAAVDQYEQVAYRYSHNGRAGEAGYAALLAYEAHAKTLQGEPLLAWQRKALDSAQRFAKTFPAHPQAATALAHVTQRVFDLGDGHTATAAARQLLTVREADPKARLTAWTVIGHTAFDDGDFLTAEDAYRDALRSPVLDADTRKALTDRLAAAVYEQGSQRRKTGDLAGAAKFFLKAGEVAPDSAIRATAEYDAAAALIELKRWNEAAQVLEDFRKRYPKHPQAVEVDRRLAVAYMESGQLKQAAGEFERLGGAGTAELNREALLRAAELQRKAGDLAAARRLLASYVQRFPAPAPAALEAHAQLIEIADKTQDAADAKRWRKALIAAEAKGERTDRGRYLAAHASLALANEIGEACREVRLVEPLKRSLTNKKWLLQRALKAYTAAAGYGVADVSTAASYAIGALYSEFGRALLESERPRQLKGEALKEYELMLEEEATPFEEKAIEVHELNIRRTTEGIYDPWVQKSYAELARLLPVRYAKVERSEDFVDKIR